MRKSIIAILMTFCLSIMTYAQTPRDRAIELKEQAQSSLNQKYMTLSNKLLAR